MVVFYGGAFASLGKVKLSDNGLTITYYDNLVREGQGISSCIPMYINEVAETDQIFFTVEEKGEERGEEEGISLVRAFSDEFIIENSKIADFIMHFAEYFLAYILLTDDSKDLKFLLFDRSLSGDQAGLIASTSKRIYWEKFSSIVGYEIDGYEITSGDLEYCRYRILNDKLEVPPRRGDYLKYASLYALEKGKLDIDSLCEVLKVDSNERKERVIKILKRLKEEDFIKEEKGLYLLNSHLENSWEVIKKLVLKIGNQLFYEEKGVPANKLKIKKKGEFYWITTLDLSFLTLFCLYMILEEAWRRNVLLVGVTKDTAATDFKNHVIPIGLNVNLFPRGLTKEDLQTIPNTDRMFLQALSLLNHEKLKLPWSLIEYDSAFKTMIPDVENGLDHVRGAIRNKISPEKVFLKTYVQLFISRNNPKIRSNVLCIDRLTYPEYDYRPEVILKFYNKYGAVTEPVEVIIYKNKNVKNELQMLVLSMLSSMCEPNVPELFGHNKPLFIADKIAKWHTGYARKVVKSIRHWVEFNPELRDFIFYMSTFRERREVYERRR